MSSTEDYALRKLIAFNKFILLFSFFLFLYPVKMGNKFPAKFINLVLSCSSNWRAVNEGMSQRAVHKAMFESVALVGASVLQIYLLQRLFERKLGISRV